MAKARKSTHTALERLIEIQRRMEGTTEEEIDAAIAEARREIAREKADAADAVKRKEETRLRRRRSA